MTRALAKRSSTVVSTPSGTTILIGLALVGLIIYLMLKNRDTAAAVGTYNNAETWNIKWDNDTMLPLSIVVHRNATRV